MTSHHDPPAGPAGNSTPDPGRARPRGWRTAALLAAAAPLAAALASAPAAVADAAPTAASATRPGHTLASNLLATTTLPAMACNPSPCDTKIPAAAGD
jgi:hypothetical protein